MGKSQKRKRSASDVGDSTEQPSSKLQIVTDGPQPPNEATEKTQKGGQRRQIRSERKRKRALQSKENALKKKEAAMLASNGVGQDDDDLATGQDFVFLGKSAGPRVIKEKRRSPRSIRKEQKQHKIAEAMAGIFADNPVVDPTSEAGQASNAQARFICFVGNLPFTATKKQVQEHFSKLRPKDIRLSTDKDTNECKGFAFLEFDNYDKLKTCLKVYHHSLFNPQPQGSEEGVSAQGAPKLKPRKINVELTAGGGGKSTGRKDKIKKKNMKLNDERSRDFRKKKTREGAENSSRKEQKQETNAAQAVDADGNRGSIHPSRLNRVRV